MKNINLFLLLIALLLTSSTTQAQPDQSCSAEWFEVNAYNKMLAFSKIARIGKVSIFIISTSWCQPCRQLKQDLMNADYDLSGVDIYYVNMSSGASYAELKNTPAYYDWRQVERLSEWPTVYIAAPSSNIVLKTNASQLPKGMTLYNKIIQTIDRLKGYHEDFYPEMMITRAPAPTPIAYPKYEEQPRWEPTPTPPTPVRETYREDRLPVLPPQTKKQRKEGDYLPHTMQTNETWYSVRRYYRVSDEEMRRANPDVDPENIQLGTVIKIPKVR
ncbi:MAG: hypothetical protein AAGG75_09885 [Bacteroidota bacterium]